MAFEVQLLSIVAAIEQPKGDQVNIKEFVERELRDLDVPVNSRAWNQTFENATEAAEILSKKELKKYIEEYLELLPNAFFQE